ANREVDTASLRASMDAARERIDRLPTGEAQPRLPGDVGRVRDREIEHPQFDLPKRDGDFELTRGDVEDGRTQGELFRPADEPVRMSTSARSLYDPKAEPPAADVLDAANRSTRRPISEPEVVTRLQDIFSRRKPSNVLDDIT